MNRRCLVGSVVLVAAFVIPLDRAAAADPAAIYRVVNGSSAQIEEAPSSEVKVFANEDRTVLLACLPGEYVYRIYRKAKKVVALRRATVLVMQDRCRPMEGASEQPVAGHLYAETASGVSFHDMSGRKIAVAFPGGTLR